MQSKVFEWVQVIAEKEEMDGENAVGVVATCSLSSHMTLYDEYSRQRNKIIYIHICNPQPNYSVHTMPFLSPLIPCQFKAQYAV